MAFTPRSEQSIAAMKRKISSLILMCGVNSFVDKANLKKSIRKYPSILTSECQPLLLTNFIEVYSDNDKNNCMHLQSPL